MAKFRWMAPIYLGITSSPGIRDRAKTDYLAFLKNTVQETELDSLVSPRSAADQRLAGWAKAAASEHPWSQEVLEGTQRIQHPEAADGIELVGEIAEWTLYDHGVLIATGQVDVDDSLIRKCVESGDINPVEDQIREYCEATTKTLAEDISRALIDTWSKKLNKNAEQFVALDSYVAAEPLWVTRAIQLPRSNDLLTRFAQLWVSGVDDENIAEFDELKKGTRAQVARWMNHIHALEYPETNNAKWSALKHAQFFWAALQKVDHRLRSILNTSMAPKGENALPKLRHELNDSVNSAIEFILMYDEYRQYSSRQKMNYVNQYLKAWNFEDDLYTPVNRKIELCKAQLDHLATQQQEQSAVVTDVILLGIGLTSLLATAVGLVQFGRDAASDPEQTMFDLGSGSITSWLSSQPMDAVVLLSLAISMLLMFLFAWHRRQGL
ncbi:hypothetical protein HMPREF2912_08015 [Corynebacterium sp. HMSC056E09]|nr:hypothetical protein HMPREF2760_07995 [Corynebacterium sp. HMSC065D07]OFN14647.1 hypothetical protein HMPREF2604_02180 [Corynebacterium sp. HMSC055A01]OFQ95663.1 hypothetical protein HMPREF2912_08015 [Corynebacterium sp. HMSC056E09]